MKKILIFAGLILLTANTSNAAPHENLLAEQFVKNLSNKIIEIVKDKTNNLSERKDLMRSILLSHTDSKRITIFILGNYARKIKRTDLPLYIKLMQDYTIRIFVNRILSTNEYETAQLKVINSIRKGRKGKEVIVLSRLNINNLERPIQIRWWLVRDKKENFKIFNLGIEGFWLAQEQRSQFSSLIRNNRGDPKILLPYLRNKIEQVESFAREKK